MKDLVNLEWDEPGGGDYGEDFSPAFAQEQADALGKKEGGIDKGADTEGTELVRIDVRNSFQEAMEVVVVGSTRSRSAQLCTS